MRCECLLSWLLSLYDLCFLFCIFFCFCGVHMMKFILWIPSGDQWWCKSLIFILEDFFQISNFLVSSGGTDTCMLSQFKPIHIKVSLRVDDFSIIVMAHVQVGCCSLFGRWLELRANVSGTLRPENGSDRLSLRLFAGDISSLQCLRCSASFSSFFGLCLSLMVTKMVLHWLSVRCWRRKLGRFRYRIGA